MKVYEATEIAHKNGYEADKKDAMEVVHGRWLVCGQECFVCSVCHDNVMINYNYCPYCGAKMDLEEIKCYENITQTQPHSNALNVSTFGN